MKKYLVVVNNRIKLTNIDSVVLIIIGTLRQLISTIDEIIGSPKIFNILNLNWHAK